MVALLGVHHFLHVSRMRVKSLTLRLLMSYMEHLFLMFLDNTQRRTTVGRTPLDEWAARRRHLYLTTHDTHNRQISMPPVGFEPTISAGERPQYGRNVRDSFRAPSILSTNHQYPANMRQWWWGISLIRVFAKKTRKHPDSGWTQSVTFAVSMLQAKALI